MWPHYMARILVDGMQRMGGSTTKKDDKSGHAPYVHAVMLNDYLYYIEKIVEVFITPIM